MSNNCHCSTNNNAFFFLPVILVFYRLYEKAVGSKLAVHTTLSQILISLFRLADTKDSVDSLSRICFTSDTRFSPGVQLGPSGGLELYVPALVDPDAQAKMLSVDLDLFCDFLESLENPALISEFFVHILDRSSRFTQSKNAADSDDDSDDDMHPSDQGAAAVQQKAGQTERVQYMMVTLAILDRFGSTLLKNTAQTLRFIRSMLIDAEVDTIALALSLAKEVLITSPKLDDESKQSLSDIRIMLQTLVLHTNPLIAAQARDVRVSLAKYLDTAPDSSRESDGWEESLTTFTKALEELGDELVPVRAHGVSVLRKMVLARDPVACAHIETIITVFLDLLENEDAFLYLSAIKGLSSLTDVFAAETLGRISEKYMDQHLSVDYRQRIGEALMQTIQRCGQVFPKYAPQIMPFILRALRDAHGEIRSSALSLLSRVAETSPLSLLEFLEQITEYILSVLKLESDAALRRGAVLTLSALLRSLGANTFEVLTMSKLHAIREQLEITNNMDADLLVRQNAGVALEDLSTTLWGS
eukprot:jgi/Hompol1/4340/HPOL_003603-RA